MSCEREVKRVWESGSFVKFVGVVEVGTCIPVEGGMGMLR